MDSHRSLGYSILDKEEHYSFGDETPAPFKYAEKSSWEINARISAASRGRDAIFKMLMYIGGVTALCAVSFALGWVLHSFDEQTGLDTAWGEFVATNMMRRILSGNFLDKLRQNIRFETRHFDPRFKGEPSQYMGQPTPEIDKLWYDLAKCEPKLSLPCYSITAANMYREVRNFGADHGTLEKLNLTKGAVQFPGTDTYQVGLEAYHQLHCLVSAFEILKPFSVLY